MNILYDTVMTQINFNKKNADLELKKFKKLNILKIKLHREKTNFPFQLFYKICRKNHF